MNFPVFLARRVTLRSKRTFSKLIVRIAIAGIMLGLAIMIIALAILRGFKAEIVQKQRGFARDIALFRYDYNPLYDNIPIHLSAEQLQSMRRVEGVQDLQAIATKPGIIKVNGEVEGVVLKGLDAAYDQSYLARILQEGTVLNFSASEEALDQVLISDVTARRLNLKVGDDFIMYFVQDPLRKRRFTIQGIFHLGVEEVDKTYIIGDMRVIQRLNNWEKDFVGAYEVRVQDFDQLDQVHAELFEKLPAEMRALRVVDIYPEIFQWLSLLDINAQVLWILMLLVAIINMISALLILILERTQMIGLLKALGFSNSGMRKVFLYHALYLIGIGMLLGNLLALGFCYLQDKTHFFRLDEASYYVAFVPVSLQTWDVVLLNIYILVFCMLSLIIPSGLVARLDPVKAIYFK